MKIDVTTPFLTFAPPSVASPTGQAGLFEDLLEQGDARLAVSAGLTAIPLAGDGVTSVTPNGQDVPDDAGVVAAQLFSFNALGILGSGIHQDGGTVLAADVNPAAEQLRRVVTPGTLSIVAPSVVAGTVPLLNTQLAEAESLMQPATLAGLASAAPRALSTAVSTGVGGRVGTLPATTRFAAVSSSVIARSTNAVSGSGLTPETPAPSRADTGEPEARQATRQARRSFAADTAETSDSVSVAVSESDGVLHVVAAAPDLPEAARQKIRSLAEDFAGDGKARLGDFVLNGVTTPPSRKFISRSRSWQDQ